MRSSPGPVPPLLLPLLALLTTAAPARTPVPPRQEVLACARSLLGQRRLTDLLTHVPDHAAGLAHAAYACAGVKLLFGDERREGVPALWRRVVARGALKHRAPRPGDLVFFRDTDDRDGDGKANDGLTHVGVVERVAADGTVTFIHRGPEGVARARLHPEAPAQRFDPEDGHLLNDWLRGEGRGYRAALAGELFAGYGAASVLTGELAQALVARKRRPGRERHPPPAVPAPPQAPERPVEEARTAPGGKPAPALAREVDEVVSEGVARNRAMKASKPRVVPGKRRDAGKVATTRRPRHQGLRHAEPRPATKAKVKRPRR